MLKTAKVMFALTLALCATLANAQLAASQMPVPDALQDRLKTKIGAAIPHMAVGAIKPGPFAGTYAVELIGGPVLYTDADAAHIVAGELYAIRDGQLVNLEELERQKERGPLLAAQNTSDMIIFPAKGERKAFMYVFTDVDCGYCRKLHKEVPELNKAGIEVRYLAYPRAGIQSAAYNKLVQAWCSDDPQAALTRLKQGQQINVKTCTPNPVADQYRLGGQLGVRGTPAIFLESGEMIAGYRPAAELIKMLVSDS